MDICKLSEKYSVRKLTSSDLSSIMELCSRNDTYFKYHLPGATEENIIEDMTILPPNKEEKDKFYIGYFQKDQLVAVMDLITDYPEKHVAHIGFFMMNTAFQKRGIGTVIIEECLNYLSQVGFNKARLAIDKGNPQSEAFWGKNYFVKTGEECTSDIYTYIPMERML